MWVRPRTSWLHERAGVSGAAHRSPRRQPRSGVRHLPLGAAQARRAEAQLGRARERQRTTPLGPDGLGLMFAAIAVYAVPVIAIASFGLLLSVVTGQSVTAVVGTIFYALALTGLAALPAIKGARPYILVTQLHAWHGPFETPTNWGLIGHAVWISALYAAPPLAAAWIVFRRRDVAN